MNEEKAKFILSGGVPRDLDSEQEAVQEALDTAAQHSGVGEWMVKQQSLTDALHEKINEVPVPPGLKDRIMAGEAVSRRGSVWSRRSLIGLAAGLVLLLGFVLTQFLPRSAAGEQTFAGLRADMGAFLSGYFSLDMQSRHLEKIKLHLTNEYQISDYAVPKALAQNTSVGCRTIEWHDGEVALICFSVSGELVHLMILPKDQLLELPIEFQAQQEGEWATTGWEDDSNVYLVATRGDAKFLQDTMEGKFKS